MQENSKDLAKIFKAFCDENRIEIIKLLQNGDKCACEIGEALNLTQSKLSYHAKILCDSGIIDCRYIGKWTHYKISEKGSRVAMFHLKKLTGLE